MITFHLPVSEPIKRFLTLEFGEQYKPSNTDWLGVLILQTINKKRSADYSNYQHKRRETTAEVYTIFLSHSQIARFGIILSQNRINMLIKAIDDVFRRNLYKQALMNKKFYGIDYKETILNCLEFYGVDEGDKSYYQTLIRDFNRKTTHFKSLKK